MIARRDRREPARAEPLLEHRIDGRIARIHDHDTVLEHELDGLVLARHDHPHGGLIRLAELADDHEAVVAPALVDASAGDPELIAKVRRDGLRDHGHGPLGVFRLDGLERFFDLG